MSFNNLGNINYKSAQTYKFNGSLEENKNDKGLINLSIGQRIVGVIKDFFLYVPTVITASIIEKYLFPKKGVTSSFTWVDDYDRSGYDSDLIPSPISPYEDSQYALESQDDLTAFRFSKLWDSYMINKIAHDKTKKKLIIYFQGNGQTLNNFDDLKKHYMETDTAFCMVDWPKHGASTGALTHESMLRQAELAYQFAVQKLGYKEEDILVKGTSLGCFQALSLAKKHSNIDSLELDQPFSTMEQVSRAELLSNTSCLGWLIGSLMKRAIQRYYNFNNMSNLDQLQKFKGSIKIIRRTNDSLTSLDDKNLTGSCLTNHVIKRIIEERVGSQLKDSSAKERDQWMDHYLSTAHIKDTSEDDSLEGDKKIMISQLKQIVEDQHVNITGK